MDAQTKLKELAIFNVVDYVMSYAATANTTTNITITTDWLRIKKELLANCGNDLKRLFSRRHYSTKKHTLNDLEKKIITYWYEKTGVVLVLDASKTHDPTWIQRPRGWALLQHHQH